LDEDEVTVREVCDVLEREAVGTKEEPPAYSTVKTTMERLVEKGHLASRKRGNTGFFRALTAPKEASHSTIQHLVERMFGGLATPLVSYLAESARLSDEDLKALERLVEKRRTRRGRSSR
jgi:BlaI family penicillinase repressor